MDSYILNNDVTVFLDNMPFRDEIECLRRIIMSTGLGLSEGIKWNGPNNSINDEDRITLMINPYKQIQIIFHRGTKVKEQLKERLLKDEYGILIWKENDRAIATFNQIAEIESRSNMLKDIISKWLEATAM